MAGAISAVAGGGAVGEPKEPKNRNRGEETATETGPRRGMRCDEAGALGSWGGVMSCQGFGLNLEMVGVFLSWSVCVLAVPKSKKCSGWVSVFSGVNLEGGRRWRAVIG